MYHTLGTSRARGRTTVLGRGWRLEQLSHLAATQRLVDREGGRVRAGARVRIVAGSVPMGDVNATDFAEVGHLNMLRCQGAAQASELLSYHSPAPRGGTMQAVMIDDNVIVHRERRGGGAGARDDELFEASLRAYEQAGLQPKASKTFRREYRFDALGAHVDGVAGVVAQKAPLSSLLLSLCAGVVTTGTATRHVALAALGLAGHALMFRREAFSAIRYGYAWAARLLEQGPARAPRAVLDELCAVGLLLPLLVADMRTPLHPELLCVDAR